MSYESDLDQKDGAWIADATIAGGVDEVDNTHPLNCTTDGTLKVDITSISSGPIDVIVDNVVPVSQSGTWTVNLATEPTIDIGIVDQGTPNTLANAWPVKITDGSNVLGTVLNPLVTTGTFTPALSTSTVVTAVVVTTSPTTLLVTNLNRKGFIIQNNDQIIFVKLDSTASTTLYSCELPRKGIFEKDNYVGPITAVTAIGSVTVLVTELI